MNIRSSNSVYILRGSMILGMKKKNSIFLNVFITLIFFDYNEIKEIGEKKN